MSLNSGLKVTEGHSNWYHSKAWGCVLFAFVVYVYQYESRYFGIFSSLTQGHIKTAEQRTITRQHGSWYTGR